MLTARSILFVAALSVMGCVGPPQSYVGDAAPTAPDVIVPPDASFSAPRVVSTEPEHGAVQVDYGSEIVIRFDRPMDSGQGTCFLAGRADGYVSSWNPDRTELTLTPSAPFPYFTDIRVVVGADHRSEAGTLLGTPVEITFATRHARACSVTPVYDGTETGPWTFTDRSAEAGADFSHGYLQIEMIEHRMINAGVAAGDYDGDCFVDLYLITGETPPNRLLRNQGDGTFSDAWAAAGVGGTTLAAAPLFADYDGDGHLDLFVGSIEDGPGHLYRNRGDGTFQDVFPQSGLTINSHLFSSTMGDYDGDGDLDLFLAHWRWVDTWDPQRLWRNNGDGSFSDVSDEAGLVTIELDNLFAPNFADIDDDGWPDLLIAGDWGASEVLTNNRDGTFTIATRPVISDENGMGAAVGDYDNDGDLDWFVSSIWDPNQVAEGNWGVTGNRLYRNLGNGDFEDATTEAGVREGFWGWASCFADFNNDGHLDIFHVNGMGYDFMPETQEFYADSSRLFVADGDGTFTERSVELGIDDPGAGRGIVCFDYDRDGDIDIFIANSAQPARLYRNDGGNALGFLNVRLVGRSPNTEGIGARIYLTIGAQTQLRELRAGTNFASQDPAEAHFGVSSAALIDLVEVRWPSGEVSTLTDVTPNQFLVVTEP